MNRRLYIALLIALGAAITALAITILELGGTL